MESNENNTTNEIITNMNNDTTTETITNMNENTPTETITNKNNETTTETTNVNKNNKNKKKKIIIIAIVLLIVATLGCIYFFKIKDNNTIMIFPYFCNKCKKRTVYRENRTSPF